jgi:probable F420-dependent oxidoreductase
MSALAFGMVLPVQAQSVLMSEHWEREAGPGELLAVARACEAAGFDNVSVCDHIAIPTAFVETMSATWYDTIATLAWLAGQTTTIKLLSQVYVLPYRHPLQVAKAFSTLDALSGGRAVLGVGVGHVEAEFDALGVSFAERGRITNEAIAELRALFADEYGSGDLAQAPRPAQPGGPPIWVGGSKPAALRRAAELGDGWLPQGPPEGGMTKAIAHINELRDAAGRGDLPFAMGAMTALYVGTPDFDPGRCLAGPPEQLAEYLAHQVAIGVTHIQVRFRSRSCAELLEQIEAFATDVVPLLGAAPAA